jgi:hypothetical protein
MHKINRCTLIGLISGLACSVPVAQPVAQGTFESAERSFSITLHADADRAWKAFGPVEEARWAPGWQPAMISAVGDPNDPDFAVFRIAHGQTESLWTLSVHDRQRHVLQYLVVNAGRMVTVIDIRCNPVDPDTTNATIAYRKVALAAESNAEIRHFAEHFVEQRSHWEEAINAYLERRR